MTQEMWPRRDFRILSALTLVTTVVSLTMLRLGQTTWLEAFSFVTGALCVWLTVKESVWNFPISMASVVAFCFVFSRAGLFADAGLQVIYFVLSGIGWYLWLYGGEGRKELHISRVPLVEMSTLAAIGIAAVVGLTIYLRHVGGAAPFWDALTTAMSLCAQWLLNKKRLESWLFWIAVDVIYIPLYLYKGLYLTSLLYAVFLCMATMGLLQWAARWQARDARTPDPSDVEDQPAPEGPAGAAA
jgi:nicotinamide mononucleotide transporter